MMQRIVRRLAAAAGGPLLSLLVVGMAEPAAAQTARLEAYPVATVDLSTAAVLRGETASDRLPVRTIAGELRLPASAAARVPAVIFLHGDAGEVSNQPRWIDDLLAQGIAVFTVDSFSGRGVVSRSATIGPLDGSPGPAGRIVDAYRALAVLAVHPRIDAKRIALMGVSSGGRTTILAAMRRFSGGLAGTDARFVAHVALYPPCNATLIDDDRLEPAPVRVFIGASDDVTSAAACRDMVARFRGAGADADLTVYAGAFHGFDNAPGTALSVAADVPGTSECRFVERDAALVNADTGRPLTMEDRCVKRGFTAGRNAAADSAVRAAVGTFLVGVLRPDR